MPFDAVLAPARHRPLAAILDEVGTPPVPLEALAANKQAQLDRFAVQVKRLPHARIEQDLQSELVEMLGRGFGEPVG